MSVSNATPKNRRKSVAVPETKNLDCYDRFVVEIASLECVLDTLVTHDLSGGRRGHLASAELVLRETIKRLHDLTGEVENLQDAATAREVDHV